MSIVKQVCILVTLSLKRWTLHFIFTEVSGWSSEVALIGVCCPDRRLRRPRGLSKISLWEGVFVLIEFLKGTTVTWAPGLPGSRCSCVWQNTYPKGSKLGLGVGGELCSPMA